MSGGLGGEQQVEREMETQGGVQAIEYTLGVAGDVDWVGL